MESSCLSIEATRLTLTDADGRSRAQLNRLILAMHALPIKHYGCGFRKVGVTSGHGSGKTPLLLFLDLPLISLHEVCDNWNVNQSVCRLISL